jgi:polyisoprenoid-binding protein YceI
MSAIETVSQSIPTGTWKLDPAHSTLEFAVRHMLVTTVKGRFSYFDATLEGGDEPRLVGTIRTASIDSFNEDRDNHLRTPEFFDTDRYPEARIEAIRFDGDSLIAAVTLKGVTREIPFSASISGPAQDPWGNERIGLELEGVLDRTEFGVSWNAPLPGGGFLVDDTVRLFASLSFVKEA